jgi:hypothetical protein
LRIIRSYGCLLRYFIGCSKSLLEVFVILPVPSFKPSASWPSGYQQLYGRASGSASQSFGDGKKGAPTSLSQVRVEASKPEAEKAPLQFTHPAQKTAWDLLAKTSLGAMLVVNSTMLFSPLISKKLTSYATPDTLKKIGQKTSPKVANWVKKNADYDTLKTTLTEFGAYAALLQLNTGYQVGINTQQPSKSLSSFMGTLTQLGVVLKAKIPYVQTLSYLSSFFWFSGETNDIKNTNNPGQRREFDQHRLLKAFRGEQSKGSPGFLRECGEVFKFMGRDFKYTLSLAPWKSLKKSLQNRQDLKTPQPYQTAIGAQLNFIAFMTATMAFLAQIREKARAKTEEGLTLEFLKFTTWPGQYKKLAAPFMRVTQGVMVFSIISYLPVLMRALQSKGEIDGLLTFVGVPMITASQVIKGTFDIKNLQGLLNMGSPIVNEGKRLNSKKYRAQVNYLNALQAQAQKNPGLKAQHVLSYLEAHPEELHSMALTMGDFRVHYILDLLRNGAMRQAQQNISFADYLSPLINLGA